MAAWFREVHALWLGRGLYAELRVADVVQEVRLGDYHQPRHKGPASCHLSCQRLLKYS